MSKSTILFITMLFILQSGTFAAVKTNIKKNTAVTAKKQVVVKKKAKQTLYKAVATPEAKPTVISAKMVTPEPAPDDKMGLSIGIKAGSTAGLTGAMGDISYSLANFIPGAQVRGGFGYLTGATSTTTDPLKMATVNLDAIYSIETASPFSVYVGGGVIYPVRVNKNRGAGAWGAHAYLGSKYSLKDNTSIYGELAYTGIKYQADESAIRGVEAMMGYSYSF